MAMELITAKYQIKDENGNPVLDSEGKATYAEVSANYDFGDKLEDLVKKCGEEAVHADAVSAQKVKFQSRLRALHAQNPDPAFIQAEADKWVSGVTAPRATVDPMQAVLAQFGNWPKEKQKEFLKSLQGK